MSFTLASSDEVAFALAFSNQQQFAGKHPALVWFALATQEKAREESSLQKIEEGRSEKKRTFSRHLANCKTEGNDNGGKNITAL